MNNIILGGSDAPNQDGSSLILEAFRTLGDETMISHYVIADIAGSRRDDTKRALERLQEKGIIQLTPMAEVNHKGQKVTVYYVNRKHSIIAIAQIKPEVTAALVERWDELEKESNMIALPKNYPDALRALADKSEENARLGLELNKAIETKSHISDKKTATAMATASSATRKVKKLQEELDTSLEYATISRMEAIHGRKFKYKALIEASKEMDIEIRKVYNPLYKNKLNSYHADVWMDVYGESINPESNEEDAA